MKTLHLDIVFDTRNINWRVAPVGTVRNGQKYELHLTKESKADGRIDEIIQEFKDVLMEFSRNVYGDPQECYDVVDCVYSAINFKDGWNNRYFKVQSGNKLKTVEYYIDNHLEKNPYTFYLTDEKITELNYIGSYINDMPSGISLDEYRSEIINYLIEFYKRNSK